MEQYKRDVIEYFNDTLRSRLRYPEIFNIEFYMDRIILKPINKTKKPAYNLYVNTPMLHDYGSGTLLQRLRDVSIKNHILEEVSKYVQTVIPNAYDFGFYSDGTNLTIKFNTKEGVLEEKLPPLGFVEPYARMAANFSEEEDLNNFCRSTPDINKLCKDGNFWGEMIRIRFPQYYLPLTKGYNREKLYRGLLYYEKKSRPYINTNNKKVGNSYDRFWTLLSNFWEDFTLKHPETLKYLLFNNLIKINEDDTNFIIRFLDSNDLLEFIKKYPLSYDILNLIVNDMFHNIKFMEKLFATTIKDSQGNILEIEEDDLKEIFYYALNQDEYIYSLEEFKFWYEYLDGSYSLDSLIDFLNKVYDVNTHTLNYILSKLPDKINIGQLMIYLKDLIGAIRPMAFKGVYNKYKHLLIDEDIDELREEINAHDDDDIRDDFYRIINK